MSDVTLINAIQAGAQKDNQPRFETGMEVEVHQIIREGEKERIQKFKGLIISMRGATPLTRMITVRRYREGISYQLSFYRGYQGSPQVQGSPQQYRIYPWTHW